MPTEREKKELEYAKRYFSDAPPECWQDEEILRITYLGGWGRGYTHAKGGLLGRMFGEYKFCYHGIPLWTQGN